MKIAGTSNLRPMAMLIAKSRYVGPDTTASAAAILRNGVPRALAITTKGQNGTTAAPRKIQGLPAPRDRPGRMNRAIMWRT